MAHRSAFYCWSCGWLIVISGAKKFWWGLWAAIVVISFVLIGFLRAHDVKRALALMVLWLVAIVIVDIITALIIVNVGHFHRPDEFDEDGI